MANPQTEDGYIRIANELYDAILHYPFSKRELKIVLAVMRKTYGFNKKFDEISLSQLSEMTGLSKSHISETVPNLGTLCILKVTSGKYAQTIELNKNYNQWVPKTGRVPKTGTKGSQNGNKRVPKTGTTKDISKNNTKRQELPDWLDEKLWADFKKFRKEIKHPLGEIGETRILKKLEKLRAEGNDPKQVIEQSIENGWRGLFPVKDKTSNWMDDAMRGIDEYH